MRGSSGTGTVDDAKPSNCIRSAKLVAELPSARDGHSRSPARAGSPALSDGCQCYPSKFTSDVVRSGPTGGAPSETV